MKIRLFVILTFVLLAIVATHAQDAPVSAKSDVWLPGKPWALEMDGTGFITRANEIQADGRRYFLAENTKARVLVSVYLEASKVRAQPGECKHSLEEKLKHNSSLASGSLKGITNRESGEVQILEFTLPELDGQPTNQKNIFGSSSKTISLPTFMSPRFSLRPPISPYSTPFFSRFTSFPGKPRANPCRRGTACSFSRKGAVTSSRINTATRSRPIKRPSKSRRARLP